MKLIGFDIESWGTQDLYGLQPWRVKSSEAWLTSFAWATGLDDGAWTHKPTREQLKKFLDACYESGTTIVAWFAPFDVSWLLAYGLREEVYRCKWLDAMLVLKHINNKPSWSLPPHSHGLKQQVSKRWPEHDGYGEDVSFDAVDLTSSMKRLEYNRWDARFTVELCREYLRKLTHPALCNVLIEAACIPMVAEAMLEGVCADIEMARALSYKLSTDAKLAYDNLVASDPDNVTPEVLASPTKLRKLLFKTWAIPTDRKTGAGALSTDSIALTLAARHDPRAKLVRTYREAINNNTKFAQGLIQSLEYNGDGVTRPAPSIFGTYSGRMTYRSKLGKGVKEVPTGIALHQWKREKEFRDTITVPEGYDLIELDAAGQEFRWMAVESGDTTMLGLCAPGEDAHSYMGSSIARVDYRRLMAELHDTHSTVMKAAKHLRKLGKFGNLSCIAKGQPVLTDRGYVRIEDVSIQDKVWDGVEFVTHSGVVFKGVRPVITHDGVCATRDHKVLVGKEMRPLETVKRKVQSIEKAMDCGAYSYKGATLRIVGGIIRRSISTIWQHVRAGQVRVRYDCRASPCQCGKGQDLRVSSVREQATAQSKRTSCGNDSCRQATTETCKRDASTVPKSKRQKLSQLWRARHRVSVCVRESWRGLHLVGATCRDLRRSRLGSNRQQWALRAGQLTTIDQTGERQEQAVYDILNAGPRARFCIGDGIVSNCQYCIGETTLGMKAFADYDMELSQGEVANIHSTYQRTYPGVPRYWERQRYRVRRDRQITTLSGRTVYIPDGPIKWDAESTAINFPIQGVGGDQKYLALLVAKNYLPQVGGRFYLDLHDGLFFIVPKAKSMKAALDLRALLSNLPYRQAWGVELPIAFPFDLKIGPSWGELVEVK
jgi:DNA polymerase I-like protein with 3'-5' exonuclease and polymerase domains